MRAPKQKVLILVLSIIMIVLSTQGSNTNKQSISNNIVEAESAYCSPSITNISPLNNENQVFSRPNGSTGWAVGDGGSSTKLPSGEVVFSMADSIIAKNSLALYNIGGEKQGILPSQTQAVHNAMLTQNGDNLDTLVDLNDVKEFKSNTATTIFAPLGIFYNPIDNKIYAFYEEGYKGGIGAVAYSHTGNNWVVTIDPATKQITGTYALPNSDKLFIGRDIFQDGSYTYITISSWGGYNLAEDYRKTYVVRTNINNPIYDYSNWQYLDTNNNWVIWNSNAISNMKPIAYQWSWIRKLGDGFIAVHLRPFNPNKNTIQVSYACSLESAWSPPTLLYDTGETTWTYASMFQKAFDNNNEIALSYNINRTYVAAYQDTEAVRPKFLKIAIEPFSTTSSSSSSSSSSSTTTTSSSASSTTSNSSFGTATPPSSKNLSTIPQTGEHPIRTVTITVIVIFITGLLFSIVNNSVEE